MPADVHDLLRTVAGPPAVLDIEGLGRRVRRRRTRRRVVVTAALLVGSVPLSAVIGEQLRRPEVALVEQRPEPPVGIAPAPALVPFDPVTAARAAAPEIDAAAVTAEPRLLPEGLARCGGPTTTGALTITTYCAEDGTILRLLRGPHDLLPEEGQPVPVAARLGYGAVEDGWRTVTVSDRDAPDDVHFRLEAPAALAPEALAEILGSVPALADPSDRRGTGPEAISSAG